MRAEEWFRDWFVSARLWPGDCQAVADVLEAARPTAECERPHAYDVGGPRGPVVVEYRPCGECAGCDRVQKFATLDKMLEGETK